MPSIVMRVRLTSGDLTDVHYEDREARDEAELIDRVLSVLSTDAGVLRCSHGDRLVMLFARGVATVEIAPQGAVL
jgi:hypothetical protein